MQDLEPRRSAIQRPPKTITAPDFLSRLWSGSPPAILDVREEHLFHSGHIEGSIHAPDSDTMALMRNVRERRKVILVCNDGRMSSMVARMLGVCGFPDVLYLEGGLGAWSAAGG